VFAINKHHRVMAELMAKLMALAGNFSSLLPLGTCRKELITSRKS
jgi:hypothetical protein